MSSRVDFERAKAMRLDGMTLASIGDHFGVTRERIRQIVGSRPRQGRLCPGCNEPISDGAHPNQKWCSENCRKRTWERKTFTRPCPVCEAVGLRRGDGLCLDCSLLARDHIQEIRRKRIQALWGKGLTLREVAEAIGWTSANAVGVEMWRMRQEGWDLPPRRAGWTPDSHRGYGPPRKPARTKQQIRKRTHYLIWTGELVRPDACQQCGREGYVDAHHPDYSAADHIEWLCRSCHLAHHNAERAAA